VLRNLDAIVATTGILVGSFTLVTAIVLVLRQRHRLHTVPPRRAASAEIPDTQVWTSRIRVTRGAERRVGIITGDMMRIKNVDIWVNPENTKMEMARTEEFSTSGMIRFYGSVRDAAGNVIEDTVAEDLRKVVGGKGPVAPGSAFVTTSGSLRKSNNVLCVIHVAAVQGEPAAGFRQVQNIGSCVANVLTLGDQFARDRLSASSILFPLLGTGVGGGALEPTVHALLGAATSYLEETPETAWRDVYFLAYKHTEFEALSRAFRENGRLHSLLRQDAEHFPE